MPGRKPTLKAFIWSPTNCEDITRWGMKYRGHEIKLGDFQYGWSLEMLQLYDLLGAMNNITLAVHLLKKVKIPYKDWKRLDAYVKEAAVLSLQVYRDACLRLFALG